MSDTTTAQLPDRTLTVHQAVAKVMQELRPVAKEGQAPRELGGFAYRRIEDVMNSLHDAMANNGIMIVPEVVSCDYSQHDKWTTVRMRTVFHVYGPRGDSIKAGPVLSEGQDTKDKSANKAHSAAFKTFLLQLFMIPTQDLASAPGLEEQERGRDYPPDRTDARPPVPPRDTRPALSSVPPAADRQACASAGPPKGEPAANAAAHDALLASAGGGAKPPVDPLVEARNKVGNLILTYLNDITDEKERKAHAVKMLGVILPGKKGTQDLDALDCERVRIAVTMLPRVAGNTIADVNEFLTKQWTMSPLHQLSKLEIDSAWREMAKAIEPDNLDIPF